GVEDLEVVERRVCDVDVAFAVHADAFRAIQVTGTVALRTDAADEGARSVEDLDAEVQRVGHVEAPVAIDREVGREVEFARLGPALSDRADERAVTGRVAQHMVLTAAA